MSACFPCSGVPPQCRFDSRAHFRSLSVRMSVLFTLLEASSDKLSLIVMHAEMRYMRSAKMESSLGIIRKSVAVWRYCFAETLRE